jgi:retinol dehydrogenase-13
LFKYLKQYKWADIKQMIANNRAEQHHSDVNLKGKWCVLTGATSGVGWEAAKELAAHEASIIMINRNQEKSEKACENIRSAYHVECDYLIADFSNLEEVHKAADYLNHIDRQIDILMNNAGLYCTRKTYTKDHLETVFCVNHLASFILTYKLMGKLKKNPSSRIIQVNSQGHRFNGLNIGDLNWEKRLYTGLRGYGASKTAQLLTVWEFTDLLKGSGVTINAMHPGAVRSGIGENNGPLYRWYKRNFITKNLADPSISGQALHYLAAAPELAGITGQYFNLTQVEKPSPHALDRKVGKEIWMMSKKITGLM